MLFSPPPTRALLWYFPTMRTQSIPRTTSHETTAGVPVEPESQPSLATVYAPALYRPVPPVGYDDDGYPYSDGAAVESSLHDELRSYAVNAMRVRHLGRDDVYAASNMGLLFERGNPRAVVVPDMMVAFGVENRKRLSFKLWEEPSVPAFALELLSTATWKNDVNVKPGLYEALGVREFWLFDPIGKLPDPLVGWCLSEAGVYEPVPVLPEGGYWSEALGLALIVHGDGFRFFDPETGDILPDQIELEARRQREAAAREAAERALAGEAAAREAAERALEGEAAAREAAERALEGEAAARKAAEARVAELQKRLRQ